MPFQNNTAQFLQFLQQQRDARDQKSRQAMVDALSERKNRLDSVTRLKDEGRKQALHEIEIQRKRLDLAKEQAAQQDLVTAEAPAAEAAIPGVATDMLGEPGFGNTPVGAGLEASGLTQSEAVPGVLPGAPNTFAGVAQLRDPKLGSPQSQIAAEDALLRAARKRSYAPLIERAKAAGAPEEKIQDLIRIQEGKVEVEKKKLADEAEIELDRVTVEEKRKATAADVVRKKVENNALVVAQKLADRQDARNANSVADLVTQQAMYGKRAINEKLTQEERELSSEIAHVLSSEIATRHLKSLSDAAVKDSRLVETKKDEYRRLYSMREVMKGALARKESLLSSGANLVELFNYAKGYGKDLLALASEDFSKNIEKYTVKEQKALSNLFANHILPDGTELAEVRLAEFASAWWLMRSMNTSGRIAEKQISGLQSMMRSTDFLTPSNIAGFKVEAVVNAFNMEMFNQRQSMRKDVEFDKDGRISTDEPLPREGLLAPVDEIKPKVQGLLESNKEYSEQDLDTIYKGSGLSKESMDRMDKRRLERTAQPPTGGMSRYELPRGQQPQEEPNG